MASEEQFKWKREEGVIAQLLSQEDIGNYFLFGKRIDVAPGEAALWISQGQIIKILTEGQVLAGGVVERLKRTFSGDAGINIFMMYLGDIALRMRSGLNRDVIMAHDQAFFERLDRIYYYNTRPYDPTRYKPEASLDTMIKDAASMQAEGEKAQIEMQYKQQEFAEAKQHLPSRTGTPLLTKDRESIVLDVRLQISLDQNMAVEVYKLLKGRSILTDSDLNQLVQEELEAKVFAPRLQQYTSKDVRERNVLSELQREAHAELSGWLLNYGVRMNRLFINPALTDSEIMQVIDKEKGALDEAERVQHQRNLGKAHREYELILQREKLAAALEKAHGENDFELEALATAAFLSKKDRELAGEELEARIAHIRLQNEHNKELKRLEVQRLEQEQEQQRKQAESDARIREQDAENKRKIELIQKESQGEIDKENAKSYRELEQLKELSNQHRENFRRKTEAELAFINAEKDMRNIDYAHQERILELAAKNNALTGEVVSEIVRQNSLQKAIAKGGEAIHAVGYAEAQRQGQRQYRQGIEDARSSVLVSGQAVIVPSQSLPHYGAASNVQGTHQPGVPHLLQGSLLCPKCNKASPQDVRFCGQCGFAFSTPNR